MYPSGKWRGWWEQAGWGRQPMEEFVLHFANGAIEGRGRDVVGAFLFTGAYDGQGSVRMVKQYIGKHKIYYDGTYDGEGTIAGIWSSFPTDCYIPGLSDPRLCSGPFAINPVIERPAPDQHIVTL
jgi:hypothetical protein